MLGAGLVLTLFTWTGRSIGRRSGVVLLGAYVAYVALLLERHLGA